MEPSDTPRRRLLLAEDDPDLREILSEILAAGGWTVVCAENGREAYERARGEEVFHAAVLDLNLPGRPGLDAAAECVRRYPSAKVILMSGRHDVAPLPGVILLRKPFQVEDLTALLKERAG